jgi:serine/threonine protein phosphatase PrpC
MGPDSHELPSEWFVAAATAIGAAHVVRQMPCQDAFGFVTPPTRGEPVVGALADGHGARRHFRSETGSTLAVEVAKDAALRHAGRLATLPDPAQVKASAHGDLAAEIVEEWRRAVARDIEAKPFTPEEAMSMARGADSPEIPYGSTLLLALVAGRWLICLQIGDGDLVVMAPDGTSAVPVPGDPALDGLRTTSLCQSDALDSFREAVEDLGSESVLAVLLVSDGYSNAQSVEPWYPPVGADLVRLLEHEGPEWVAERLPEWARLCASAEGSGDDTTMVLMVNRTAATGRGATGSLSFSQARTVTEPS